MHPYLRAYMSGITLPTMIMPAVLVALSLQSSSTSHPFHIEEVLVFPMGLVPNAWGLWNVLYVWLKRQREVPIGLHGAALLLVLAPLAYGIQVAIGKVVWTGELVAIGFPGALAVYYLGWKFVVSRLNDILGIS